MAAGRFRGQAQAALKNIDSDMYKIKKTNYGYHLTFSGFIKANEMFHWLQESKKVLKDQDRQFSVFVDMRDLKPLRKNVLGYLIKGQLLYKQKGMQRSVVIISDIVTALQFQRIAKETGIYEKQRFIPAPSFTNWKRRGLDWILHGIDPGRVNPLS